MKRKKIKSIFIGFALLMGIIPLYTCKKFHTTLIQGKLINYPINKGIAGETIYLKSYQTGAILTPDKAKIELSTITDQEGNFSFSFEAYKTTLKQRQPVYIVFWPNTSNKKSLTYFSKYGPKGVFLCQRTSLNSSFNNELSSSSLIENFGEDNFPEIKVALACNVQINCINDLPNSSNLDTCEIRLINQIGDFYIGSNFGENSTILTDSNYICYPDPIPLISGTTTIRAIIKKNNQTIIKDTTFFVEDKEYYFEFRY
jgi:hypothetical protein